MGIDFNVLPVKAIFPINQSGIHYFPATLAVDDPIISAVVGPALASAWKFSGAPAFSAAQAYGFGLPDAFVQQFGGLDNATVRLRNTALGAFGVERQLAPSVTLAWTTTMLMVPIFCGRETSIRATTI
jgi:hypothetical protein